MEIIGGSFGVGGSAWVSKDHCLVIEAGKKHVYRGDQITGTNSTQSAVRKFGVLGFLVGAVVLGVVLYALAGVVGFLVAIVLAAAGSFYQQKQITVAVSFDDGRSVSLKASPFMIKKLLKI